MFFNTQCWFFYGFQLILIKQNLCLSNFIWALQILQKLWLSRNVIRIDWTPHGKSFQWKRVSNQLIVTFVSKKLGGLYIKPDVKIDRYETEKSHIAFWSSLSECLHIQKWYQIHIGVDFISVILTDLKFNTRYESFFAYLQYRFAHENMKNDNSLT